MKILLVQPSLAPPGGGNLVAAWMLEALRDEHALSLLAWKRPDWEACNRYFGTSLRPTDVELYLVPRLARWLGACTPTPLSLLKHSYLLRYCAALADRYDVVVTANNEADFGRRGIQYIHYPKLDLARPPVDLHFYHRVPLVLGAYYRFCARVGRFSTARMKGNLTLVNSDWIASRVRALHGVDSVTLHPPVPGTFPAVPWEAREDGFVCIGRLSPEKRVETIVDILARVRAAGGDVRLHVVGSPDDRRYGRRVARLAQEHAAWVSLHVDLPRTALLDLVARQRYGIHAMADEHFGIAVAEMIRAGCICFVPSGGGPAEIVGREERLLFGSPEEAARNILATLRDSTRQASLRAHLARRGERFSTERFVVSLRKLVRQFAAA